MTHGTRNLFVFSVSTRRELINERCWMLARGADCNYKERDCPYRRPEPEAITNAEATRRGEESQNSNLDIDHKINCIPRK